MFHRRAAEQKQRARRTVGVPEFRVCTLELAYGAEANAEGSQQSENNPAISQEPRPPDVCEALWLYRVVCVACAIAPAGKSNALDAAARGAKCEMLLPRLPPATRTTHDTAFEEELLYHLSLVRRRPSRPMSFDMS